MSDFGLHTPTLELEAAAVRAVWTLGLRPYASRHATVDQYIIYTQRPRRPGEIPDQHFFYLAVDMPNNFFYHTLKTKTLFKVNSLPHLLALIRAYRVTHPTLSL